jgi:small-conductance mechanosensitive channel
MGDPEAASRRRVHGRAPVQNVWPAESGTGSAKGWRHDTDPRALLFMLSVSPDTSRRLLFTALLVVVAIGGASLLSLLLKRIMSRFERGAFWSQQALRLIAVAAVVVGLVAIWFDALRGLATVGGLLTAGVAVALQRVIMAFAGYLIILRGKLFTVGDRITIGGVRGDVVALGFMQTTVLEMGEPPGEQPDAPATWVRSRQYTGRIVRITNDKIFDTPVYNYTREFQFVWEEMHLPISYKDDRARAEQILLEVARKHTDPVMRDARPSIEKLRDTYSIHDTIDVEPHVYYRITDNWVELTLRFVSPVHGTRPLKDAMSREILTQFEAAKIGIASGTYEIVGMPPIRVQMGGAEAWPNG